METLYVFPIIGRKLLKDGEIFHLVSSANSPLSSPDAGVEVYNRANFDSTLIIIFAAFLGSVISTLAVRSILRCALRCNEGRIMEAGLSPDAAHAQTGNHGSYDDCMKKIDLKALPAVLYGSGTEEAMGMDCPICLAEFVEGEKLRVVPQCNHSFHVDCFDRWLLCNPSCPSCRLSLLQ